jgi:competence protein ComGB
MRDGFVTTMVKKWSLLEQGNFLRKIGEMLERGYSYSEAVESLVYQLPVKRQVELANCLEELKAGQPLYSVLGLLHFQEDIIGYIYFADKHGGMLEAINEGSRLTLKKQSDIQRVRKAFIYPIFLFLSTCLLFIFVKKTLLPQYFVLYETMGIEANIFTKIINMVGHVLPLIGSILIGLLALISVSYFLYLSKLPILYKRKMMLKLPFFGSVLRMIQTQYFTLQLGYLLSGGLSVYESLQLFETTPKSKFYMEVGRFITDKLKRGEDLPSILIQINLFELELPIIIKHGQSNGRLDKELLFYSQSCLRTLEVTLERSLKIVQPILYGVVGFLVISMYLSIMLPMFSLLNGI